MKSVRGWVVCAAVSCGLASSAACDTMTSIERTLRDVEFVTDGGSYLPGERIEARLVNRSDEWLYYNLCFTVIERLDKGRWA